MNVRTLSQVLVVGVAFGVAACDTNNPARPTMTFSAPTAQSPAIGTIYNFNQQPITLAVKNVARTGNAAVTYSVEVASNSSFTTKVFSREGIAEGAGGTTSVTLGQLEGGITYYWQYKAVVDGIVGEASAPQNFLVRPNVVIQPPAAFDPPGSAEIFAARPTFTVNNASRTGPAGTIFYEFQVSNNSSFSSLLGSATVQEQSNRTSWTPNSDLPEGNVFWRVRASDPAAGVTSGFSSTAQFVRRLGVDLASVTYLLGPNISSWPQTAKITSASHVGDTLCIERSGGNFPSAPFIFDAATAVEGNQWMFVNIGGKWYGGAGHWYRPGQSCKGEVDEHFFPDAFAAEPFHSLRLHSGDVFAVALSTPARAWPAGKTTDERSDVVFVVW
jgi:hypothetical protein